MKKYINAHSIFNLMQSPGENNEKLVSSFLRYADNDYHLNSTNNLEYQELLDFHSLFSQIIDDLDLIQLDGYFFNSSFQKGIREQFDILRFSENRILNIELKSQMPAGGLESIKNQLIRHKYMLNLLDDTEVSVFTYNSNTKELYTLDDNNNLINITVKKILEYIEKDFSTYNFLDRIDITEMVISPYTEPQKFIEHLYFLNNEQLDIKNKIISDSSNFIILKGGPGSGKSLVLFDLAKYYTQQGLNVAVIFSAKLTNITAINDTYNFDVISTNHQDFNKNESHFCNYDVLLVDETQRLYSNHKKSNNTTPQFLNTLVKLTSKMKVIFSIDHNQSIHDAEIYRNNQEYLESNPLSKTYKLKYKVRSDKKISTFIQKMLNISEKGLEVTDFPDVQISYFNSKSDAILYTNYLRNVNAYKLIELNEYRTVTSGITKRPKFNPHSTNLFDVYGQEYDSVAVIIDEHYIYYNNYLIGDYRSYYPYNQINSFLQALTRVRNKLEIVVVNNPDIYVNLQKIMTWKEDKVNGPNFNYFDIGLHTNKNSLQKILNHLDLKTEDELKEKIVEEPNLQINISVKELYNHLK